MTIFQEHPPALRTLSLSFGVEKHIIDVLSKSSSDILEAQLVATIQEAFTLAYPSSDVVKALPKLVEKVVSRINKLQENQDRSPSRGGFVAKSFGTEFSKWLGDLDSSQVCLYLANYDVKKAEDLYWFAEIDVVRDAIKLKAEQDNQLALLQLEACLYGAGGQYSDDAGSSDGHVFDMDSEDSAAALRNLGF